MSGYDIRQDAPYRRGLILGLTIAEVMILLIFILLMALASALSSREKELEVYQSGVGSRLVEAVKEAFPDASSGDDYYKELVRAIEAKRIIDQAGGDLEQALADELKLAMDVRDAARAAGAEDVREFVKAAVARNAPGKKGQWPPFFSLSEAGGYYFESGKATLRPDFRSKLETAIIPILRANIDDYGVNVVEVIGHTDEVPMVGQSNLDSMLIPASRNQVPTEELRSTDNAGLAMARAVAVVRVLRADPRLSGVTILPLSGAQLIIPGDLVADGRSTGDDQRRRRIEIRLRRSSEQVATEARQ